MNVQQTVLEDGRVIVPVHLIYPSPPGVTSASGRPLAADAPATWKVACEPGRYELGGMGGRACPLQRTDDYRAVSCPLCRATQIFHDEVARLAAAGVR